MESNNTNPMGHGVSCDLTIGERAENQQATFNATLQLGRPLLVLSLLLALLFANTSSFAQRNVGVNLAEISQYSTQIMLKDVMKQCSDWYASPTDLSQFHVWDVNGVTVEVPMDTNGYPTHAPFDVNGTLLVPHATLLNDQPAPYFYPSGNYTLIFEGQGRIMVHWDDVQGGEVEFTTPNVAHSLTLNPSSEGIDLVILESDTMNPVRNIRLVLPGQYPGYLTDPFVQEFTDLLAPFDVLRFMKPQSIEENSLSSWSDRTLPGYYHYGSNEEEGLQAGLPYELAVQLCNEESKDGWFNIPHEADNNFIEELAVFLRDNMDSSQTIYLEYGNETWNGGYANTHNYVNTQGIGLDPDPFTRGQYFHVVRSIEIFETFDSVFAGQTDRLYRVICSGPFYHLGLPVVTALQSSTLNPSGYRPDGLAIAPYIGSEVIDNLAASGDTCNVTHNDLLDSLTNGIPVWLNDMGMPFYWWADDLGLELISYEGGQYLSSAYGYAAADSCSAANLIAANRDGGMGDVYCNYHDYWYDTLGASLMMTFNLCEGYNAWGAMGLVESTWQNPNLSPKWASFNDCGFVDPPTKRAEPVEEEAWKVYPNPASGRVYVAGLEPVAEVELRVFDLQGQQVRVMRTTGVGMQSEGVDLAGLPAGMYWLRVKQGDIEKALKVVRQ